MVPFHLFHTLWLIFVDYMPTDNFEGSVSSLQLMRLQLVSESLTFVVSTVIFSGITGKQENRKISGMEFQYTRPEG